MGEETQLRGVAVLLQQDRSNFRGHVNFPYRNTESGYWESIFRVKRSADRGHRLHWECNS
jgi:hypothetical protein